MRIWIGVLAAAAIGAIGACAIPAAFAEAVRDCNADYEAKKATLEAAGTNKADFIAACREELKSAASAGAAPAAPASVADAAPVITKTKQQCTAEYTANRKAITASGKSKAAFDADCRAGTEVIPTAPAAAAAAPAPADPMAPKPLMSPAQAQAPATKSATSAGAAEAQAKCPSDKVVWVNAKAGVYRYADAPGYGAGKKGAYMCETDATAAGDRAAAQTKRP